MKISYQWLKSFLNFSQTPDQIANCLTQIGLEVSHLTPFNFIPSELLVGKILTSEPHPNAEKLRKTTVDIGSKAPLHIICGAPNAIAGEKVVVAPIGTTLQMPNKKSLTIQEIKIRGEISEGMLCAEDEIGLGNNHDEIIVLNTKHTPGTPLHIAWNTPPDTILHLELTPNRNDATAHLGIARDLAALLRQSLEKPIIHPLIPSDKLPLTIKVKDNQKCPRYAGVVIIDLTIQASPIWLQNRLRSIGIQPINNVVDITNFVLHDLGQPLHAFDYDTLQKKKIILQTLPQGTPFTGLDGIQRTLHGTELMVCDSAGPLSMAGILGGARSKVTHTTKRIFLESAYFDPNTIQKASKQHGIQTQAAFLFARGTDPNLPYFALQKAAALIQEYAGGRLASMVEDHYPIQITTKNIEVEYAYINQVLGYEIPPKKIHNILQRLDIPIQKNNEQSFTACVPPYRRDVERPIDLIEEILRIYGYNQVAKKQPSKLSIATKSNGHHRYEQCLAVKQYLVHKGYQEIVTNSLMHTPKKAPGDPKTIHIKNPISQLFNSLRTTLLPTGLQVIQHNLNRQQQAIKCFEVGTIYQYTNKEMKETKKLSIWLAGDNQTFPHWQQKQRKVLFADLYTIVQDLFTHYHLTNFTIKKTTYANHSVALELGYNSTLYGQLVALSPAFLAQWDIQEPVFFAELYLKYLLQRKAKNIYQPIPKYLSIYRDISLLLHQETTFSDIQKTIQSIKIPELQSIHLIDIYQHQSLGKSKKGYTIRLILRSNKKTLHQKEIQKIITRISSVLTQNLNLTVRD